MAKPIIMMIRSLIIGAALLALAAPAQAGELPVEFAGEWCGWGEGPVSELNRRPQRGCKRDQDQWFIQRDRYEFGQDGPDGQYQVRVVDAAIKAPSNAVPQLRKRAGYSVKATCRVDGEDWKHNTWMVLKNGKLIIVEDQ